MKPATLLICASLAANVVIGLTLWSASRNAAEPVASVSPKAPAERSALRHALEAHDFAALVAAGVPEETARRLVAGFTFERYQAKLRAAVPPPQPDPRWWRNTIGYGKPVPPEQRRSIALAEREMSDALTALYGEGASLTGETETRLAFLPTAKREAILRLEKDLQAEVRYLFDTAGLSPLQSEDKRAAELRARYQAQIAELLTPEERGRYERSSVNAMERFGPGIESEDDWRVLTSEFLEHDRRFPPDRLGPVFGDLEQLQASLDDTRQRYDHIRETLGPERFATLQKLVDQDRYDVGALQQRLGLPPDTVERVIELRERYATESQRIPPNPADERGPNADVQALAVRARQDLAAILGAEAADAYARRPNWVSNLGRGLRYSTSPSASSTLGPNAINLRHNQPWSPATPPPAPAANPPSS